MKHYQLIDEKKKYYSLYKVFGQWAHKVTKDPDDAIVYTEKDVEFARDAYFEHGFFLHRIEFKPRTRRGRTKTVKNESF